MPVPPFRLPDELLDMIFWFLRPRDIEHVVTAEEPLLGDTPIKAAEGSKADLLACGFVCRHWRQVAVPHLFYDIKVTYRSDPEIQDPVTAKDRRIDVEDRTAQFDYWNTRYWGVFYRYQSLFAFYTFLRASPCIQPLIKRLRLDARPGYKSLQPSTRDGFTAVYHLMEEMMKDAYAKFNFNTNAHLFSLVIGLLPSLQELSLYQVRLTPMPDAPKTRTPALPELSRLFICGSKDPHVCDILRYFRKVHFVRIEGLRNPSTLCARHDEPTALEITTLSIEPYASISMGFYSLLRASPSVATLRALDLGELLPDESGFMEQQALVNAIGSNLERLRFSLPYGYMDCEQLEFLPIDVPKIS
jgi:hypothetical protein